jgi:NTE family protein
MALTHTAVVLGAGGAVGAAYHAGVIAALDEVGGFDARRADLLVGTSAGAGIAASLRAGLSPADHLARAAGTDLSDDGGRLLAHLPGELDFGRRSWSVPLPASPRLATAAFLRRGPPRPGLALAGLLPRGTIDSGFIADTVDGMYDGPWPDAPTWICAVDLDRGRRVVFGRDDVRDADDLTLGRAVQASSAVPGLFRPTRIGRLHYVDGAVHSPTSADLVAGLAFDVVVVVSPMTAVPAALGRSALTAGRAYHAQLLRREVAAIRRGGTTVVTIQPTADDLPVLGLNAMDHTRRDAVARRAFESTRAKLERPELAPVLTRLVDQPVR